MRDVRNGSSSIVKDENNPDRLHAYYSKWCQTGPNPEDQCFDNPFVSPSTTNQRPRDVGERVDVGNIRIPRSTTDEILVSKNSRIEFVPKDYKDRLRIYSGKHKIFDSGWIKRKSATEIVNYDLDIHMKRGEIECNTIRVRTTSGWNKKTNWSTKVIVPGNVDK